jgi:hypothetical protein
MGTVKVAILEIDGTELDVPTEMDLNDALVHVGLTSAMDTDFLCDKNYNQLFNKDYKMLKGKV